MKDIAKNDYAGLGWKRITVVVFAYTIIAGTLALFIQQFFVDFFNKTTYSYLFTGITWTLLTAIFSFSFDRMLIWQTTFGWPRYFIYTFKFSNGDIPIVGWTRISLNSQNGTLSAEGYSFLAQGDWRDNSCVKWTSENQRGQTPLIFIFNCFK